MSLIQVCLEWMKQMSSLCLNVNGNEIKVNSLFVIVTHVSNDVIAQILPDIIR